MKIAVFGAGALGGYFGGRLLQAGHDVSFIARGNHLAALQQDGLYIKSSLGNVHLKPVVATDAAADIGPVDLVLFLVKLYDTTAAAQSLKPLLAQNTVVVSLQNGVECWQDIGTIVGADNVMGGSAYIFADVREPGVIHHRGTVARIVFGEFDGRQSARASALSKALGDADVESELVNNVEVRIWEKFVLLSALSGITALTRLSIGAVLEDSQCSALFREALNETALVGLQTCAGLSSDIVQRQLKFAAALPYDMHASMLDDLRTGKRLELNQLSGAVVRLGKTLGIDTPVHSTIQQALHPYVNGRRSK